MTLDDSLTQVFKENKLPTTATQITITCVDPSYPAGCVHSENTAEYDNHHVQSANNQKQLFLVYDKKSNTFKRISSEEVHDNLPKGIAQIAYTDSEVTLGIPGDIYAFYDKGEGFAFGKPYEAGSKIAQQLLLSLIDHTDAKNVLSMGHPDCGLYANNHGMTIINEEDALALTADTFADSEYAKTESQDKAAAADHLMQVLRTKGVELKYHVPEHQKREPGIKKVWENAA